MKLHAPGWFVGMTMAAALFIGCASSPKPTAVAASPNSNPTPTNKPPPLAVESFQAAWEIIRDTHFDTNFNGLNWNRVRTNFLPRVEKAGSQQEVRDTIQEMLDLLKVSHLMILPGTPQRRSIQTETNKTSTASTAEKSLQPLQIAPPAEAGSLGIEVRVLTNQIIVFRVAPDGPAAKNGIKLGWIVDRIDDEPAIDPMVDEDKNAGRQREFLLWHYAAALLKGAAGEKCTLAMRDEANAKKIITLARARETGQPAKLGNLPTMFTHVETNQITTPGEKRVGYLRFNLWMMPVVRSINQFVDANRNSDAIIMDLRGNVGGIGGMVMGVAGHFVDGRPPLGKMKMRDNELNFVAFPQKVDTQNRPTNLFGGKLAIIVDGMSLSSTELFAGGMQELGRARIFGEKTGGQALPAVSDRLPNGDLLYHAVADFTTPKGRRLEENGVVPDEIVPLRLEALRAESDEPLQAALRWIESTPKSAKAGVE